MSVCALATAASFLPPMSATATRSQRDLPGVVSERRDATLFHAVWRHDRAIRFGVRLAVRQPTQRQQIRAGCRSGLLLPAQGSELGGGAGWDRGEASAPPGRYSGDAG